MKLFSKIATAFVGIAMAVGVGVALKPSNATPVRADDDIVDTLEIATFNDAPSAYTTDGTEYSKSGPSSSVNYYATGIKNDGSIRGNKGANTGNFNLRNSTTKAGYYVSKVVITETGGTMDPATSNRSVLIVGTSVFPKITNTTVPSGTQIKANETAAGTTLTFENTDTTVAYFQFYSLKTSGTCSAASVEVTWKPTGTIVTTYTITYDANGGSGTMDDSVGTDPVVADCEFTAPIGKEFERWNTSSDGSGTDYAVGAKPGADLDLFAIWQDAATYDYVETVLKEGQLLITTTYDESTTYYLPTDSSTSSGPLAKAFSDVKYIDPANLWTVTKDGDNWVFQNSDDLYLTNTVSGNNNGIRVTDTACSWAVQEDGSLLDGNNSRYLGVYNGQDWRSYNASNHTNYKGSATSLKFYEVDEPAIDTAIYDSSKGEGPFEVVVGNTLSLFYYDLSVDNYIEDATWVSSDPTVFDASGQTSDNWYFHGKGLKEGQVTMTASKSGYKVAQAIVNVVPDPTLPEMEVWDTSSKVNDNASYYYSSTADIYKFTARKVGDSTIYVDDAVWESSDTTVATVTSSAGQCSLTTLKPGELDLTATSSSYQSVTVHIEIIKGSLEELNYDGNPSKTEYSDTDSWSADGVTITATYHSGWTEDVTSQVEWSFNPANPALGVESVVFTASFGGETVTTAPWAVTVVHHHAGTAEDPFTVAEGIAKCQEIGTTASGDWYVRGIISAITSTESDATTYGNATFNLSDDGSNTNFLIAYQVKYIGGVSFDAEKFGELKVGLIAVVHGALLNYKGNTPEFNGKGTSSLVSLEEQPTGDISITFEPPVNLERGDTGSFVATTDASNPVYTYSVDTPSLLDLNASTGAYEVIGLGVVKVTVEVTSDDGNGEASAFITLNDSINNMMSVDEANAFAATLESGVTTDYYVYVEGFVTEFETSKSGDNPRALDICNSGETERIMVFTGVGGYSTFVDGLSLGTAIRVKAHVQNYGGTYELTSPEKVYTEYVAMTFAFEFIAETDAICKDYDGVKDNKEALEAIWTNLETKYDSLTDLQKSILVDPNMYGAGDTIKNAMARYDYVVGKYSLDNFISGRTPVAFANQPIQPSNNSVNTNFALVSVIIVAVVSVSAIGVLLVVKKRKYHI